MVLHYWLYDTASTHGGGNALLHGEVLPAWIGKMGYCFDTAHITKYDPNTGLADTVKQLMRECCCNVSVTLIRNAKGAPLCYINEEVSSGHCKTTVCPLRKKQEQDHSSATREKALYTI